MGNDDEFIEDDYYDADEGSSSSGRPFLIAVGGLLLVLVLAIACTAAVLSARSADTSNGEEVAAIETQNAIIAVTNMAVTAAINATQTAEAQPTNTPLPTSTATPEPATATATPVVSEEETAVAETAPEEEGTAVPTVDATEGAAGVIEVPGDANTPTPTPLSSVEAGKDSSLPQTGLETWGIIALGAVLVIVLLGARRLRAS
ncbi:MAG TPA: hypothetical protein ENJ93_05575 [Chloroflexi bacterium]|nr:hypothetical protein [Chloroflexota bacterium]